MTVEALSLDLTGKVAAVTGGSGELGRSICETLARCGAKVAVGYHTGSERAEQVVEHLAQQGWPAVALPVDVTEPNSVGQFSQRVTESWGQPASVVVANAVVQIHPWKEILDEDLAKYDSQYRSCVLQSVLLAKAFVPGMIERGWGRFIGINTECTMQMFSGYSAYAAGKRGMDGVLRVLAREVGQHGITVNQVAPGWVISEKDRTNPPDDSSYVQSVPLRRRGTDQEVANVVAFLASDLASYVHGAFVPVCGGNVMPTV